MEMSVDSLHSLDGLFSDGPKDKNVLQKEELTMWLKASAPDIAEIPHTQDLQNELSTAKIMALKTFQQPCKESNETESNNSVSFASQCGNKTKKTNLESMTLPLSWFANGGSQCMDYIRDEQRCSFNPITNSDENTSAFKKSLFRKHDSFLNGKDKHIMVENGSSSNAITSTKVPKEIVKTDFDKCPPQQMAFSLFDDSEVVVQKDTLNMEPFSHSASSNISDKDDAHYRLLKPVTEIPKQFRIIFKEFPYFNYIQSKALDHLLYSDRNFVLCAPTGSGKTVIFELAIIRLLMQVSMPWTNVKIVYMAPIKALCGQRFDDWKEKFGPIGLNCKELTGDTQMDDLFEIQHAHIIMTTPEKWDSMTRKWKDNTLVQLVRLFLIDEVHILKEESRGATLEVVVSRMKTIFSLSHLPEKRESFIPMRFVAVSATIPNVEDIAAWLSDGNSAAEWMKMDETRRPVKLRKVVLGFPCSNKQSEFKFDLTLNYKIANIIQTYSDRKPTLVFCATRKGVQQAASILTKDAKFVMSIEHKQRLQKCANPIKDSKLRDVVQYGVGYHHAGVDIHDRKVIENTFLMGDLPVLFTTSTLAMGVNLPAHLVIIKSTMHYVSGMFQEYSETDILQMIGRAGRPQFDSTATAVIMTRLSTKEKYLQMLDGAETIESSLHKHLVEHLNAEIALHTITDVNVALEWIRSTFLYIRALKNSAYYGFSEGLDKMGIEAKLQELCLKNLNDLSSVGLIKMDEEINFKPTETGKLMALYYIAFNTAKLFHTIRGTETLAELVSLISSCAEFSDVQLRANEKRVLNTLNKDKNRVTIRYPMEGKIKTKEMKVNCLIQAHLGCILVQDFSLSQDISKIFRHGTRLAKCLSEFLALQENKFSAFLNALFLTKCFKSKLWENSLHVSKQLEKIGVTLANAMVNAGLTTFKKIEDTNAREIELIVNRHPPFGNQIKESVANLPKYDITFQQLSKYRISTAEVVLTVLLTNFEQLQKKRTAPDSHYVMLVIGDDDNQVIFKQKIMDSSLLKTGSWTRKIEIKRASTSTDVCLNLVSSEYVGLDIQRNFNIYYLGSDSSNAGVKTQQKSETFSSKISKSPTKRKYNADTDCSIRQTTIKFGTRECNHNCKNKDACGHECCKFGVSEKAEMKTNFCSYLNDLRTRNSVSSATPVKRLKMQMEAETRNVNLKKFVFAPKPSITPSLWSPCLKIPEDVLIQAESNKYKPALQEETCCKYESKGNREKQTIGKTKKTCEMRNLTDSDKCNSSSDSAAYVTFDLGNNIWEDFDDDNLLDASSISSTTDQHALESTDVSFSKNQPVSKFSLSAGHHEEARYSGLSMNKRIQKNIILSIKRTPTTLFSPKWILHSMLAGQITFFSRLQRLKYKRKDVIIRKMKQMLLLEYLMGYFKSS
ncbi:probable ATP-dependent DNA helicase HFM1 isoform X2 [Xenopus laevis]|uniref:Probable ATP-dependent DNA helicase HFM1 n=1 Tax=Xenopus laevis TaxID=8355 RepID=A0A8J1MYD1_XENLA|nr:probable ATP-dependent DNA helicase HFM1 isoform X2 [Xenopus laevis]